MDENKKQKNSEYVGVDEKYIPEEEKYVDESLLGDREQSRKTAKRIGKGYIIGLVVFLGVFLIFFAFMVTKSFGFMGSITDKVSEPMKTVSETMEEGTNSVNDAQNQPEIDDFNFLYETYEGTQSGLIVVHVLDNVITKNSTENKQVTVIYGSTSANDEEGLTNIKSSLNDTNNYDVSLSYDKNGYVNKITITDM